MNASGRKRYRGPRYGEPQVEKHMTVVDEHKQTLLEKQLERRATLSQELVRTSKFTEPVLVKDDSSLKAGKKTLLEFQLLSTHERRVDELREHGLNEDEIQMTLRHEQGETNESDLLVKKKLRFIREKIKHHEEELKKDVKFSGVVTLSRREFEAEKAFYRNSTQQEHVEDVAHLQKNIYPDNDPVLATLRDYKNNKKQKLDNQGKESEEDESESSEEDNDECKAFIGPQLSNVNERVGTISEDVIFNNRISLNEIHEMDRFKEYKAGIPNKTLYIKNLSKGVKDKDLARLFSRYYKKDESNVDYKLMCGRMRGQAFITFKDERIAMEALLLCNGYKLQGKPIIISYGKPKTKES